MKKRNFLYILATVLMGVVIASCSSSDDKDGTPVSLSGLKGIVKLTKDVGDWDAAYVTKSGYFMLKEEMAEADGNVGKASAVVFMSEDGDEKVSLIADKSSKLPSELITDGGTLLFSFLNDSILELVYDDGKNVQLIDSIPYSKEKMAEITAANKEDVLKQIAANVAELIGTKGAKSVTKANIKDLRSHYAAICSEVADLPFVEDAELVASLPLTPSGSPVFVETMNNWYEGNIEDKAAYELSIWTGKATFKVGGSSCTLSGSIWCPSCDYEEYGTYGIICDADESNLTLDKAEYVGKGKMGEDGMSFDVDFRGLKPNTTYYYKAYYEFNGSNHGGIVPKHGEADANVIYDPTLKWFATGDNHLTVDVVMCIDVTGSMSDVIHTVKENAISFYDSFKECCENNGITLTGLNAQVIAFRDKNVDITESYPWLETSENFALPEQKDDFKSFVNWLEATGGGDTPESGLEVLQEAFSKTDWGIDDGYHRQVVIVWTDAPYLVGESYTDLVLGDVETMWNKMPSGRRLVLFAPNGDGYCSNGGGWENLDSWTNVIHSTNLYDGFNKFEYILEAIIGELTGKAKAKAAKSAPYMKPFFRPNK